MEYRNEVTEYVSYLTSLVSAELASSFTKAGYLYQFYAIEIIGLILFFASALIIYIYDKTKKPNGFKLEKNRKRTKILCIASIFSHLLFISYILNITKFVTLSTAPMLLLYLPIVISCVLTCVYAILIANMNNKRQVN